MPDDLTPADDGGAGDDDLDQRDGLLDEDAAAALLDESAWNLEEADLDDPWPGPEEDDDEDPADSVLVRQATGDHIGPGPHTVLQGECLAEIAYRAGHLERTIWDHGDNAELRSRREDPSFLAPGDVVQVPPIRPKQVVCATGQRHVFQLKGVPARLHVRLMVMGAPRGNVGFSLSADGQVVEGRTDAEGWINAPIRPDAREAKVTLDSGEAITLHLGAVDPLEEHAGVQARLANLGYGCEVTGELDGETREALEAFQEDEELEVNGEIDAATRDRLKQRHGS